MMLKLNDFAELFRHIEAHHLQDNAFNVKVEGEWKGISYDEFVKQVKYMTLALADLGLVDSQNVGILSESVPRWFIADLSTLLQRATNVPMYHNVSEDNFLFQVKQAEIKTIFVSGTEAWELVHKHYHLFDHVIAIDKAPDVIATYAWDDLLARGKKCFESDPQKFNRILDTVRPDDTASIMYTSGTTGVPKGAVHTHRSLIRICTYDKAGWNDSDIYLNILPACHIMGRMTNYIMFYNGARVYFLTDILRFRYACQEVRPTELVVVPRILEKVYNTTTAKIDNASGLKKLLGKAAIAAAHKKTDTIFTKLLFPLFDKLVYSKIRDVFGGKLISVFCGGANLNPELDYFYGRIGIPISVPWGMTEVSIPTISGFNTKKVGTVGPAAFDDVEVVVSKENEVIVRGTSVMREYYKNPEATQEVFDEEGWFHTGDRGTVDEEGYITIERRIKELYKTSGGEYISPIPIEVMLQKHPMIEVAIVIGEGKKYATALLFPDFEAIDNWKKSYQQDKLSNEQFLQSKKLKSEMMAFIKIINQHLNSWEKIHNFVFIPKKASIKGGELTPTMKLRRFHIVEKYKDEIDAMYHSNKNSKKR